MSAKTANAFNADASERLRDLTSDLIARIPFEEAEHVMHDECMAGIRDALIELGVAVLLHQYRLKRKALLPQVRVAQGAEQKLWQALVTDIFVAHRTMQRRARDAAERQGFGLPWHGVANAEQQKKIQEILEEDTRH